MWPRPWEGSCPCAEQMVTSAPPPLSFLVQRKPLYTTQKVYESPLLAAALSFGPGGLVAGKEAVYSRDAVPSPATRRKTKELGKLCLTRHPKAFAFTL